MPIALLATKLRAPQPRPQVVSRSRLTAKLLASVKRPGSFALLSGPAGFGKTTLLSEFIAGLPRPVAWVSLDEADNDPIRFWTYLLTACRSVQPDVGESGLALLQIPQLLPAETLPTLLINDLVQANADLVIVLDDYHTLQNQAIHSALSFLLDHLPENLHLVISTRLDPPLPLARLRARSQLTEVRAADLRFTSDETAAFLNRVMGLNLSSEDVAALEARTEGWIASLQLAALSMQGRNDLTGFIQAFTGSHVYVAEYLIEEVLGSQPEAVKTFLMQTSILERLSAGLCEAVSGQKESQTLLRNLYQANLFVMPLDDEGQWYRYHQLFADLLQARLQQTLPADAIAALHQRAAAWYTQAGMLAEAMEHALLARDFSYAVQIFEKIAMPMILNAYFITVENWLRMIPAGYLMESVRANLALAWMYLMRRNFTQAGPYLERLQRLRSTSQGDGEAGSIQGEWLALQSMLLGVQGRVTESADLAEQALKLIPVEETQIRSMTYMGLANLYEQRLEYERAAAAMNAIIQSARRAGDLASEILGISLLGRMLLRQGRLRSVYELTSEALRRIERAGVFSPFSATLHGELAQVYYHWHKLEEARRHFARSVELSVLGGFSDAEIYHNVFLSRLFQMEGDLQASAREIEKALNRMRTAAPAFVREEVIAQRVNLALALGQPEVAQAALQEYGFHFDDGFSFPEPAPEAGIPEPMGQLYNSALRILLYQARVQAERQDLGRGMELTEALIEGFARCQHLPVMLQTLLLRSQMYTAAGKEQDGFADVVKALELAEPERVISAFVEEGLPLAEMLGTLLHRGLLKTIDPGYVHEILAACPGISGKPAIQPAQPAASSPNGEEAWVLIEPLTPRELEVLQHIAAGDSNQEIADKLVITLSAVKKHTGNIFRKLGVSSRTQAVVRARKLGLLAPDH